MQAIRYVLVVALPLVALPWCPAHAGRWHTSTGFSVNTDYSGNVFLKSEDTQSDLILRLQPRLNMTRSGGRVKTNISYAPELRYYLQGTADNDIANFLNASSDAELIENWFGVRVSANAGQNLIDRGQAFTQDSAINPDNVTDSYSLVFSPYILPQRVGRYFTWSLSYDMDYTAFSSNRVDNSLGRQVGINLASGPFFTTLEWDLSITKQFTDYEDSESDSLSGDQETIDGSFTYHLNRIYALIGDLGYDNLGVDTNRDVSGIYWRAGLEWEPNPRNSARFMIGDRYGDRDYEFEVTHKHRRTNLFARYNRELTDARREILDRSIFPEVDAFGNEIDDPFSDEDSFGIDTGGPTLEDGLYIRDQFRLGMQVDLQRTGLSLEGYYGKRDSLTAESDSSDRGLDLTLSRDVTPKLTASLSINFLDYQDNLDASGDYQQWSSSLQLSRQLSPDSSVQFRYTINNREGTDATNDFIEDHVSLQWVTQFQDRAN